MVVEPSAAVAYAEIREGKTARPPAVRIGLILTGGNVDMDALPWPWSQKSPAE